MHDNTRTLRDDIHASRDEPSLYWTTHRRSEHRLREANVAPISRH
jgi:hypothetical protein